MPRLPQFVNFHILHPVPFSNPNRDDTGAPKTMTYGGSIRGRMSSQADKRASRIAFEGESTADRTGRSKFATDHLMHKVTELLAANDTTLDDAESKRLQEAVKKELGKLTGSNPEAKDTLMWLAEREVNELAKKVVSAHADSETLELTADEINAVLSTSTESLTIAAFGRMFANRADLQIEAAVQVAHAFTTHSQEVDLDYFTAVDDLQASYDTPNEQGKGRGAGAGHLDINEFHSGVFYRYFNVNRADLKATWLPAQRGDEDAPSRVAAFLDSMIRDLPRGREATAAHQAVPAVVMATFSSRGTTYAPAFETPVTAADGGYVAPSRSALMDYADKVRRVDGDDHRLLFDLDDPNSHDLAAVIDIAAPWLVGDDDVFGQST